MLIGITRKRDSRTAIPDEIRYANVRWRLDNLATAAWGAGANKQGDFYIDKRKLEGLGPEGIIAEYLRHISKIAPGLPVPIKIPEINKGALKNAGGTFGSTDGWAVMTLSEELIGDERAVRAVLAHEVCHYVLNCASIREDDTETNEKLTDLCMFVLGLGKIYLDGYKSETVREEYRVGHRLGYLTDNEYRFADDYINRLRSKHRSTEDLHIATLRAKIVARVGDERIMERLIENERRKNPNLSLLELYQSAFESQDR